ncbi:MAG TPA: DUF1588 domain-containing protein [Polyangiaceae bacterium]|nr:DUF1588 domain-containing protein [Polyangiaceae bacterium]
MMRPLAGVCMMLCFSACTGIIADSPGVGPGSSGTRGGESGGAGGASGAATGSAGVGAGPMATGGSGGSTSGGVGGAGTGPAGGAGGSTGGAPGVDGGTNDGGSVPDPCQGASVEVAPSTMQLLTREQYVNSVHDLLGTDIDVASSLPDDHTPLTFGLVQGNVAQVDLENYGTAAETAAAAVVATTAKLDALAPCAATTADKRTCARAFVQSFGARAYRAPVTDAADIDRHLLAYDLGATTSYAHGIEMLLRAMLQAPRFLYRAEPATLDRVAPQAVKLSGYEVASRLSYAVWNTMPDARLTAAAAAGTLSTKDGVAGELAWMLADPRGVKAVRRFLEGWVHLSSVETVVKDKQLFPDWANLPFRAQLRTQGQSFFDQVLSPARGSLPSLFTLDRADGSGKGLLTLPALLGILASATESSPIYRGKFVREQLLCQELPAPPPNVPKPPDVPPGVSTREKFKQHEADPACSGCHRLMDPIGFAFENYDAVGRYRTTDNGAPVDVSGEVFLTRELNGPFNGIAELSQKLATSAEVEECAARQWFRFFLSRFEQSVDSCSMKRLVDQFHAAGSDLKVLPLALVGTDAFLYRRPVDEVSP